MTVTHAGRPARGRNRLAAGSTTGLPARTRTMRVPRSRGAVSGFLLVLLGAWGALVPFFGPYLNYSYGTDQTWHWTTARLWLEVLPGAAAALGGLLLLVSAHRISASFGGWLAALAGAWFVLGQTFAPLLHLGSIGKPLTSSDSGRVGAQLGYFYGLGVVILFLAAFALGRMAVVGVRDVLAAERADELARQQEMDRTATRDDGVIGDGVLGDRVAGDERVADDRIAGDRLRDDRTRQFAEPAADGTATGRYEPDRPYESQDGSGQPTTRYDSGVVGSEYGSSEYQSRPGSTAHYPTHQAPDDDRR
jgi:hypothetical protein